LNQAFCGQCWIGLIQIKSRARGESGGPPDGIGVTIGWMLDPRYRTIDRA
jgi:hypothetical protein